MLGTLLYSGMETRGLPVELTEEWFNKHIAARHRDFDTCWPFPSQRSEICLMTCSFFLCLDEALQNPLVLKRDKENDDRDNYYGPPIVSLAAQGYRTEYLKVCVQFRSG